MKQGFFAQIEPINDPSFFEILEKDGFYYYYFTKNQLHYIFLYFETKLENSNKLDLVLSSLVLIRELNTKKRRIRSIRGLLIYALELIDDEKLITLLKTNFRPQFWNKVQMILRQNKKNGLLDFLSDFFQSTDVDFNKDLSSDQEYLQIKKMMNDLQNQVILLQKQIQTLVSKDYRSNVPPEIEQTKTLSLSIENSYEARFARFIQLSKIPQDEKEEIIKNGFKLSQEKLISLQDYYEGIENPLTLFESKGFSIKYDTIRKDKYYRRLKDQNFKKF